MTGEPQAPRMAVQLNRIERLDHRSVEIEPICGLGKVMILPIPPRRCGQVEAFRPNRKVRLDVGL